MKNKTYSFSKLFYAMEKTKIICIRCLFLHLLFEINYQLNWKPGFKNLNFAISKNIRFDSIWLRIFISCCMSRSDVSTCTSNSCHFWAIKSWPKIPVGGWFVVGEAYDEDLWLLWWEPALLSCGVRVTVEVVWDTFMLVLENIPESVFNVKSIACCSGGAINRFSGLTMESVCCGWMYGWYVDDGTVSMIYCWLLLLLLFWLIEEKELKTLGDIDDACVLVDDKFPLTLL